MRIPSSSRLPAVLLGTSRKRIPISLLIALTFSCDLAFCQSQSQPSSQPSQSQQQSQAEKKDDSAPGATKKSEKEKPKPKKVYTEEDLSGMRGGGISVVGDVAPAASGSGASPGATGSTGDPKGATGKAGSGVVPMSGQDEAYWRGKAKQLLDEIASTDQEIEKTKADIKKYGTDGFDATSGFKDNVIYIENRNARLQELQKHKADLEKKLDQLQEDGRKAGAAPDWFR